MIYKARRNLERLEITFESPSVTAAKKIAVEEIEPSTYPGVVITLTQYEETRTGVWPTGRVWKRKAHNKRGWLKEPNHY